MFSLRVFPELACAQCCWPLNGINILVPLKEETIHPALLCTTFCVRQTETQIPAYASQGECVETNSPRHPHPRIKR